MKSFRCPICDREFDPGASGVALPFCSPRCKGVDAGRWLDERYGLPLDIEEEAEKENVSGNASRGEADGQ